MSIINRSGIFVPTCEPTNKVTSADIKIALGIKHGDREFFLTECKSGPTWLHSARGLQILDGLAIYKSWASPRFVGYEVKVSRSDFLSDVKFNTYLPLVHELYIVCPKGMIDRTEIPEVIGLMYYDPKSKILTTKKKAIYRDVEIDANMLLYIIYSRLDSDRVPFYSTKKEHWKAWLAEKEDNKSIGRRVKSKLLNEIRRLEGELDEAKIFEGRKVEYESILDVMRKHDLYARGERLSVTLDRALCGQHKDIRLESIKRNLKNALADIESMTKDREESEGDGK